MGGDGGFLSRWSRRKRAAAAEAAVPAPPAAPPEAVPPEASDAPPPAAAPPAFDPESLPPVESLTAGSDFAAFLREEVPAALRRAALRRAWTLDPAIREFVGPAEYAWDYNAPGGVPGFSLDVPNDLERLIAQVVGPAAPADDAPPPGGEAPPPVVEAAAPLPAEPPPVAEASPPPDAPVAGVPASGPAPVADAREGGPAPEALPDRAPVATAAAAIRKRHGGALPS